jgi:hypothetical protein
VRARVSCAVLGAALLWIASACRTGESRAPATVAAQPEFTVLQNAAVRAAEPQMYRNFEVVRRGRREKSMVLVAPVEVRAEIGGPSRDGCELHLQGVASAVFNLGDGMTFQVLLARDGAPVPIYERTFDPGRAAADRDWSALDVPLDLRPGERGQLLLRLGAGPQGDLVGDWLALARLAIVEK